MTQAAKRLSSFVVAVCCTAGVLMAQPLSFERFTSDEGLYSVTLDVLQDQRGFLWFATDPGGVRRYDGYTFQVYMHDPYAPDNSLARNSVNALAEDGTGHIWMSHPESLSRYDPKTDTFMHFRRDSTGTLSPGRAPSNSIGAYTFPVLYTDPAGQLWVGTTEGVLYRFDAASRSFTHYPLVELERETPGTTTLLAIHADTEGKLWVGTDGQGLFYFDPATGTATHYPQPWGSRKLQALLPDPGEGLWVGTNEGLYHFDPAAGGITPYRHDPANPESLSHDDVRTLAFDDEGRLWIGTNGGGLNRLVTAAASSAPSGRFVRYQRDPADPTSLTSDIIQKLYADRQGSMWATTRSGASRFEPTGYSILHYKADPNKPDGLAWSSTFGIMEAKDGALWLGSSRGLRRLDRTTGAVTRYRNDPDDPATMGGNMIMGVYEDQEGMIWGGSFFSVETGTVPMLNRLDPQRGTVVRYPTIASGQGYYEDTDRTLWVAAANGLFRLSATTRTIEATYGEGTWFVSVFPDGEEGLWLGATDGLYYFDQTAEAMEQVLTEENAVMTVDERRDEPGVLWLGTRGGGLIRYDTQTGQHTRLTAQNSDLPDNTIWGILEDDEGHLWLTMDFGGLIRFSPDTRTVKAFDVDDGVQGREFNAYAYFQSTSGEFFVGGTNGVNAFFPSAVTDNPYPPEVALTQLALFNEPVVVRSTLLPEALFATEQLTLAHEQHDLAFGYVGLHFSDPARNRYAYMLEGYDDDWVEAGTQRMASYTNLSPGTYTFRVKAANSDGVWNEDGASVRVVIRPPWWRTAWAYGFYVVLFAGGVFTVDRVQRRRLIAKERQRAEVETERLRAEAAERELEQAREIEKAYTQLKSTQAQLVQQEKMASLGALTAGIAHEIKNPLNFINNFAEVNEELADELQDALANGESVEDIIADLKQNAAVIAQHGKRADGIVKSMMAHAREGKGEREVVNLNALIDEHVELAYHGKRAQVPEFKVEIERVYDDSIGKVEIVPQDIGRVILNLVGNAFDAVLERAAGSKGQYEPVVHVSSCKKAECIEIRVTDNGPGMNEAVKAKVFEPFFTTKPTGSGTGLGLSLSYDIITQGHGGTLTVESDEGEGAAFVITLPLAEDSPGSTG